MKMMTGFSQNKEYERSGQFASQAVDNIRTVVALGRIQSFISEYAQALKVTNMPAIVSYSSILSLDPCVCCLSHHRQAPARALKKIAWVQGITFGFSEFSLFAVRGRCHIDSRFLK